MLNGNGPSSRSTQQLGAGGGDKPPRHPWPMKSMHELDGAARGSKRLAVPTTAGGNKWEPFQCSFCECFFISQEDLNCHIRRCHVHRNWRRGKEASPRPPPSVAEQYVLEKRPSLGGHPSSSSSTSKNGSSGVSKQEQKQQTDKAAAAEAPAIPVVKFPFDLNDPAPEVVGENRSSG